MQERTFAISTADMASLLMLLTDIDEIIGSGGAVSDEIIDELRFIQPELERIVISEA